MAKTTAELVAEARSDIREIAPNDVALHHHRVLIDVREPAEFATGHIDGAINIPRGMLEFQIDTDPAVANVSDPVLSQKEQTIVVYCRTGSRAALAAQSLKRLGFSDVSSIAGGITAWTDAGLPVSAR